MALSRKRKADDFEWETSKENVMPLKRGRNVADLNKALRAHDSLQTKLRLEDELKAKEDAITAYDGDDPLAGWLEYVRWLEVKMPEDTRKKFSVLEKCTRELKDNPRYQNDLRYIRVWIQYADLVSNPKDIFKYLYQNKIGERVSLFYIGWAYVLETMANYPQAHKIYLKASQKNAEPQDMLERKYKEFQRRMSRQWLRMTEETGTSDLDEAAHRRALESLSVYGTLELNDAQRQQLHQHHASARAQRVQKANSHKPVFIVYEDPAGQSIDPFDGNGGWKNLGTMQQQDKENELAPTAWNPSTTRRSVDTGRHPERRPIPTLSSHSGASPLQVFVDDEFSLPENEPKRRTPLTHRSLTLRQRVEGVTTEEERLAQEPLKNFTASDKKACIQKQGAKDKVEKSCYDVKQTISETGESFSFEEIRARAYKQAADKRRILGHRALQNVSRKIDSASNVTTSVSADMSSAETSIASHRVKLEQKPTTTLLSPSHESKLAPTAAVISATSSSSDSVSIPKDDKEDMTINTRVALEDINNMFCSPPRPPKAPVWEPKEDDPVERKLHFSIFDDSVDSVAVNQSLRQDPNELIPKQPLHVPRRKQTFQIFSDDDPEEPRTGKKTWSQKRKPLGARDDLVRSVRLTNKDVIMQAEKDAVAKGSTESTMMQSTAKDSSRSDTDKSVTPFELDPYTPENRRALILDSRVDWYLCSRPDGVKRYSQKLPKLPTTNPVKRKLRRPIIVKASPTLTFQLVGVLGSGSFAFVFSANVIDTASNITQNKAVKVRTFSGILTATKWCSFRITFPEVLAVYYSIKMMRYVELLHGAKVLHGDIKPDNWLMTPGNPAAEVSVSRQEPPSDRDFQCGDLYLIDYGRSIDLSLYPDKTVFRGNCHTKGFQCVEMLTQRPWTYQIDTFALCGTIHCMLYGAYMEVKPHRDNNGETHWGIVKPFKRYWQVDMWKDVFHSLLNVSSCIDQPSLPNLRRRLENYFVSDASRQQVS
ncbi:BUB protein kinase [Phytophthora megakarya]|uniref:BUB protein kinase n=1 Tax=Phytophthora megakarya TaxID=4795 RepID=A0A225X1V2_9STRA|nr:BUB protein kinase [Phytophthora megakarya]